MFDGLRTRPRIEYLDWVWQILTESAHSNSTPAAFLILMIAHRKPAAAEQSFLT